MILLDEKYSHLLASSWVQPAYGRHKSGYAVFWSRDRQRTLRLHRVVMELHLGRALSRSECVDHINRNGLDNRIENLRVCTQSENMRNQVRVGRAKGVYPLASGRWYSSIRVNCVLIRLGSFDTKLEAIAAYNAASERYHGEFGRRTA